MVATVLAVTLLPQGLTSQITFERTYGGPRPDYATSVRETTDGGYIIAATSRSFEDSLYSQAYGIRTDGYGDTVWTRQYGTIGFDGARAVRQTLDGGFVFAGSTESGHPGTWGDVYLVKTDARGDTLWTRAYGGTGTEAGLDVVQTSDQGYLIVGLKNDLPVSPIAHVYIVRTDLSGSVQWTKVYGEGMGGSVATSVDQTRDGGFIVAGLTGGEQLETTQVYLLRITSLGDTLWTRTYGAPEWAVGESVRQTWDGGYIVAGTIGEYNPDESHPDVYLIKTDASGDTSWTRRYGGALEDWGNSVQQTADGGYIVAGSSGSFGGLDLDVYLVRTDRDGRAVWATTFGREDSGEAAYSVQQTWDGGFVLAGYVAPPSQSYDEDVYLIKMGDAPVEIESPPPESGLPRGFSLSQNCPNPFNPSTTIRYEIPAGAGVKSGAGAQSGDQVSDNAGAVPVRLRIYDLRGRLIRTLVDRDRGPGRYAVHWDGRDDRGARVGSGVYLYRIECGRAGSPAGAHAAAAFVETRKMVVAQ